MISTKPLVTLLLEAAIDDNALSTNGTPFETPSVVNGVGESMVVLLPSLNTMVMERMPESREMRAMESQEERGDQEKQYGMPEMMMCPGTDWTSEKL